MDDIAFVVHGKVIQKTELLDIKVECLATDSVEFLHDKIVKTLHINEFETYVVEMGCRQE